ncbi:hypothetical protein COCVIDRAFT_31645 [Bipolaris victoriae FI3]|uniref:Spindle pole body component n=1 Tax=Bipolaris victoriae (strain FI3) TaxID=930091 RepID=W7DYE8_BIPV3|nr:hypothetical protein COCVIDRAFT_31645 [Bipolaris victoriae FI3]
MNFDIRDLATFDDDRAETQSLLALPSTRSEHNATSSDQVGIYSPAQPNISSNPDEIDMWDYFESTRRSASYHLDEYFHFREDVRSESAPEQPELQDLVDQKRKMPKQSAWRLKVARDSLLNELETSTHLLDIMSGIAKKGLAKYYVLLVLL